MISLGVIFSAVACMAVAALLFTPKPAHQVDAVQQDSHMPTVVKSGGGQGGSSMVGSAVDSRQIDQRLLESQATTGGDIEVSLAWNSLTDLDLQVRDPSGELISAEHRRSASGGVQDVDANPTLLTVEGAMRLLQGQCPGPGTALPIPEEQIDVDKKIGLPDGSPPMNTQPGYGERVGSRFTRTPVEHIYFAHAPRGTYKVYAHCYSWREPNPTPLPFTIQIRSHGKVFYEMTGTLGPASYIIDNTTPTEECQFDVP